MKLAILSDFHLGYERFYDDAYKQAEEALELASQSADVLIIPGDLFDARNPKPEVLGSAINLFRNLAHKNWKAKVTKFNGISKTYTDIPIIAIPGTHERRAQGVENPVGLLGLAGFLVDVSQAQVLVEKDDERVSVYGIGGISEERFGDTIRELNPVPEPNAFNVFMFHQSIYELLPFSDDFIKFDDLPKGFDLYVDGHIHNKVEKKVHGKNFLIPGSTVLTQLKEGEQEHKGFFIYDTKTETYEFKEINCRKFLFVKLDVNNKEPSEINSMVEAKIKQILSEFKDVPVIRFELNGKMKDGFKNLDVDGHSIVNLYKGKAIIEIAKSGVESADMQQSMDAVRHGMFENMSVKDYGLGIFVDKLKQSKYDLKISTTELFDLLSSDQNKEKSIKKTLDTLFAN